VDRGLLHTLDWASLVDGLTNDVHDSTEKRQLCSILDMC
jgi:hypothetical protein